jgi:HJR/Mrr/RecB family endonuclease
MSSREADVVVTKDGKTVIVELKRTSASASVRTIIQRAVTQAAVYLHEHNVVGAVAFVYSARIREYQTEPAAGALADLVRVVAPQADRNRSA